MPKKQQNTGIENLPVPTSGTEWRRVRNEGVLIKFPSGHSALVRPIDFTMVVKIGKLPDSLTPIVVQLFNGETVDVSTPEAFEQFMTLADVITQCAFVSPRIVDNPTQEDEISLDDVSDLDKAFVYGLLGMSARDLQSFRKKQEKSLELIRAIEGVESEAEPDDESDGMGDTELSA